MGPPSHGVERRAGFGDAGEISVPAYDGAGIPREKKFD